MTKACQRTEKRTLDAPGPRKSPTKLHLPARGSREPSVVSRNRSPQCSSIGGAGLYRRAGDGRVRTIDAAVSRLRLQQLSAMTAIVEPLTGIGRHHLGPGMTTQWARDGRLKNYGCLPGRHVASLVMARKVRNAGRSTRRRAAPAARQPLPRQLAGGYPRRR